MVAHRNRRKVLTAYFRKAVFRLAPIAQLAEAADLKSAQCRFESDWGHYTLAAQWIFVMSGNAVIAPIVRPSRVRDLKRL